MIQASTEPSTEPPEPPPEPTAVLRQRMSSADLTVRFQIGLPALAAPFAVLCSSLVALKPLSRMISNTKLFSARLTTSRAITSSSIFTLLTVTRSGACSLAVFKFICSFGSIRVLLPCECPTIKYLNPPPRRFTNGYRIIVLRLWHFIVALNRSDRRYSHSDHAAPTQLYRGNLPHYHWPGRRVQPMRTLLGVITTLQSPYPPNALHSEKFR